MSVLPPTSINDQTFNQFCGEPEPSDPRVLVWRCSCHSCHSCSCNRRRCRASPAANQPLAFHFLEMCGSILLGPVICSDPAWLSLSAPHVLILPSFFTIFSLGLIVSFLLFARSFFRLLLESVVSNLF